MIRANGRALSRLLSVARRHGVDLLAPLTVSLIREFPVWNFQDTRAFQQLLGRETFEQAEIRDFADYAAATFNLLERDSQSRIINTLASLAPGIDWSRAFVDTDEPSSKLASQVLETAPIDEVRSQFYRSTGPSLLPAVSIDQYLGLLRLGLDTQVAGLRTRFDEEEITELADDGDKRRVAYWSIRLFLALRELAPRIVQQVPGFWQFAVGFFDPEMEKDDFGIIALTGDVDLESPMLPPLVVDDRAFPIVVRRMSLTEHSLPLAHPRNGTFACWASSREHSRRPRFGALTAKHVVGSRIGKRIQLSGISGRVIDVAPQGIDAALVETSERSSPPSSTLRALKLVPAWLDVVFVGAGSEPRITKVTATTDQLGILDSPLFPVKVLLADPGQEGDSGALVLENSATTANNAAVGIYVAAFNDPSGRHGGIAQHMRQVVEIMDMELYK